MHLALPKRNANPEQAFTSVARAVSDVDRKQAVLDEPVPQAWRQVLDTLPAEQGLAGLDGLELAEDHWQVIRFIREYYLRYESVPMPKVIIKGLNKQQGAEVYTIKHLYALFPHTPMRRACRYAGVPQPAGCS